MDGKDLKHRAVEAQSGGVRAAVLGINDGLATNIALILGVAGATPDPSFVRIAGVASLVAGACSMAVGEYISMRTQVELLERVLGDVRSTIRKEPQVARALLETSLVKLGIDEASAATATADIARDPERALRLYAASALGINEKETGSPLLAAIASLVTFALGAAVPLLPWFALGPTAASTASIVCGGIAAFIVGAFLGNYTDGRWLRGGIRQVCFIALAAGITYGVGRLFRVAV
jgi:VIT1/CCC1 family predicted Fe2+/Mn2+ transporter